MYRTSENSTVTKTADGTASVKAALPVRLASRLIILTLGVALVSSALAYGAVHSWALAIFQAAAAVVVALWGWDALAGGTLRFSRSPLQVPLAALVVIGAVQFLPLGGATLSLDPFQTRLVTIKVLALFVYFAAALAFIDRPERLRLVVRLVIIFGFVLALIGMVQSFVSPEYIYGIRKPFQAVPFGPFVNGHHFANYMLMALALPLGLLFSGAVEREQQLLFVFASFLMGIALIATGSRGAMLSLVVEIGFLLIAAGTVTRASKRRRHIDDSERLEEGDRTAWLKRVGGAGALFVMLLGGVLVFGGEAGLARLVGTVNAEDPTTGRTQFWAVTLDIIRAYPIIGVGLGAFGLAYTRYDTSDGIFRLEQAHNDYLQVLADTGIIGAVFGIFFVVALYRIGWRRLQSVDTYRRGVCLGALAGCTAMFAHSFFEFSLHTTSNALLFLVLAALATLGKQVENTATRGKRRRRRSSSSGTDSIQNETIPGMRTLRRLPAREI